MSEDVECRSRLQAPVGDDVLINHSRLRSDPKTPEAARDVVHFAPLLDAQQRYGFAIDLFQYRPNASESTEDLQDYGRPWTGTHHVE
jgi:hypothetical protein